jgi:eukaryotic-like serine/threonine-protein kinase
MDTDRNIETTAGQKSRSTGTVDQPFPPDSILPTHEPPKAGARYRITRLHRSGGLGRVWVARDEALGRDVALKDLLPERVTDSRLRNRFIEEARITGQLEHPYIVPLYDLIDGPNGPCYTMRFAAGKTLAEAAREYHARRTEGKATALDLAGLLDAFVAVCRAVAYAHSRNVLHRDLKGQNVVLGEYGEVFVLDWGLAKIAPGKVSIAPNGSAEASPAVVTPSPVGPRDETMSGSILGTPAFLAPEQVGGRPASTATDIYGLGAVLYVILTGNAPYDGPTMQDVLEQVSAGPPRQPRTLNPNCPAALEAVCRKAMAREAAKRYPNAEALAADVRRWQADEPVEAYREPWSRRVARWARRHRPAVIGAAAVLMTAVFALAISTMLIWQEERRTAAERDRAEANLNAAAGLAMGLLEAADRNWVPNNRRSETARKDVTAAALSTFRAFLRQQTDDPKLRQQVAKALRFSANFSRLVNDNANADKSYRESVHMLDELDTQLAPDPSIRDDLAETLRDEAQLYRRLGKLGEAVTTGNRAAKIAEGLVADQPDRPGYRRTLASGLVDLSGYDYSRARFVESEASARRSVGLFRDLVKMRGQEGNQTDVLLLAMALHRQAIASFELGNLPASLLTSDEALDKLRSLPPNDADVLHTRGRIVVERAKVLLQSGKLNDAERDLERAIAAWDTLQKRFPQLAMYREYQAAAFEVRGRILVAAKLLDRAAKDMEQSRVMLEALSKEFPKSPDFKSLLGRTYLSIANFEADRGNLSQAAESATKSMAGFQAAIDLSPESAMDRRGLNDARALLKRFASVGK